LALAKQNAELNRISNISIIESDRFSNLRNHSFAAILTNPPIRAGKKVIYRMFEESKETLLEHGELWIVIQKKQGAASAKKKLESLFRIVEVVMRDKGYFVLRALNS